MLSRSILATASVAMLWSPSMAAPSPVSPASFNKGVRKDKDYCPPMPDYDSEDQQRQIWDTSHGGLGVGQFLDDWIQKDGADDWINNMDQELWNSDGGSKMWCNGFDTGCPDPGDCGDYDKKGKSEVYWIKTAVKSHYDCMNHIHEYLQDATIEDSLQIPDIIDTFGDPPEGDMNILGLLSSALVMASAGAIGSPTAGAALTAMIGGTGLAGQLNGKDSAFQNYIDTEKEISDQLRGAFKAYNNVLETALSLATTNKADGDLNSGALPGEGPWASGVAKYFDAGRWLIGADKCAQDIKSAMDPFTDKLSQMLKRVAVIAALKKNQYFAFIRTDKDEGDCGSGADSATYWVDGQCVDLWVLTGGGKASGDQTDQLKYMKSADGGTIDFPEMYQNAIDCAKAHPDGDGKVDWNNLPDDGSLPECFYNIGVWKGTTFHHYGGQELVIDEDDPINTTDEDTQGNHGS